MIRDTERAKDVIKYGKIVIKDNCFIGLGSIILPGVTIGPNSIVAAGSVVTKDVEPDTVVGGNPAKKITTVPEYMESVSSTALNTIKWHISRTRKRKSCEFSRAKNSKNRRMVTDTFAVLFRYF